MEGVDTFPNSTAKRAPYSEHCKEPGKCESQPLGN